MSFEEFMADRFPEVIEGGEVTVNRDWLRGFWLCALQYGSPAELRHHRGNYSPSDHPLNRKGKHEE